MQIWKEGGAIEWFVGSNYTLVPCLLFLGVLLRKDATWNYLQCTPWSSAIGQREKMSPVIFQLETLSNISHYEIGLILKCHDVSFLNNRQNSRQNSHQKSPQSPNGGILLSPVNESCRGSNSTWKTGIASFIWFTQSKIRSISNNGNPVKL